MNNLVTISFGERNMTIQDARANSYSGRRLSILILYDEYELHVSTTREHLESFFRHSIHHITYARATKDAFCFFDLAVFDVVVIHYTIRLSLKQYIAPEFSRKLADYRGLKVLYIQDEYEATEQARQWMDKLCFDIVFTCVPPEYVELVYPQERFPGTRFIQTLTGYVPDKLKDSRSLKPLNARNIAIGYRGRLLPFHYGDLAHEKYSIGSRMREACEGKKLAIDIEWTEDKRIYGDKWYDFVEDCRATLGTESGANIFDDFGLLKKAVAAALARNPSLSYEQIHGQILAEHEGKVKMNQVSARIFEAIALKTALILFEGSYSGVILPNVHYIPLKKDFTNVDEVLAKLNDDSYLTQLTERAYNDIILSGKYTYASMVAEFDQAINSSCAANPQKREQAIVPINYPTNERFINRHIATITSIAALYPWRFIKAIPGAWLKYLRYMPFPGRSYLAKLLRR